MKKFLALALALVLVMSLCACGNKDSADGTKPSETPTTGTPTEGKTDATQPSGENNATQPAPTTPAPTTPAPTTPAPTTPAPTTCSHSWKAATCTAPKTCTKCGVTEGNALGHTYENGSCKNCGEEDTRVPFSDNIWLLDVLGGDQLYRIGLDCSKGMGMMSVSFWSENGATGEAYQFGGKTYYEDGFGKDADLSYTEDGDTVNLTVSAYGGMTEGTITLKRANATQYTISAITGTIINDNITKALTVGSAFSVFILNIE